MRPGELVVRVTVEYGDIRIDDAKREIVDNEGLINRYVDQHAETILDEIKEMVEIKFGTQYSI